MSDTDNKSPDQKPRETIFTETGAILNDEALAAFIKGMTTHREPTPALIAAMARAKNIRRA